MGHKVLYLSHDGLTDPLGQSQILPYLMGLARRGCSITILSFEKKTARAKSKQEVVELCQSVNIRWVPMVYHNTPAIFSTVYDLLKLKRKAFKIIQQDNISIVHCRSYPTSLVGLAAKRRFGVKFVFDMRGFWADERVEGALWRLDNFFYRTIYNFFKKKERAFFSEADHIVSLTEKGAAVIRKNFNARNITVIPCCADTALFDKSRISEEQTISLKNELKISDNFVLLYLGSIGTWYLFEQMLDFFEQLRQLQPRSQFLIVSQEKDQIITRIKERGLNLHSIVVTKATRDQVPHFVALADFSILFIRPTFSKQASSPTKLAESLAMDVPVLANREIGDIDQLIEKHQAGVLIDSFDAETLKAAAKNILTYKQASSLRAVALSEFSLQKGVDSYENIYRQLLTSGQN